MKKYKAFIALGSNLGDREENLKKATVEIESNFGVTIKRSSIYETKPWGKANQPDFVNQVVVVDTFKSPEDCLTILLSIEDRMGRKREEKWGARIIDLDLLYVGNFILETEKLKLPHPGIPHRKFVLVPLVEIDPEFIHPQLRKTQQQLLAECSDLLEVKSL